MSANLALFILVVLIVVGGFALGTHSNVRRGHAAMRWLQDGLPMVGEKTTIHWLGSSVVQLKIQQAKQPFREAEVMFVLEPRDVAPLWLLARTRGRRDLFIFRSRLHKLPGFEIEAFVPGTWSARGREHQLRQQKWQSTTVSAALVAYSPEHLPVCNRLLELAALPGCPLLRLSVQRADPNFEVHWPWSELRKLPANTVFEALRKLAQQANLES